MIAVHVICCSDAVKVHILSLHVILHGRPLMPPQPMTLQIAEAYWLVLNLRLDTRAMSYEVGPELRVIKMPSCCLP